MGNYEGYDKYRYDGRVLYGTVSETDMEHAIEDVRSPREMNVRNSVERENKKKHCGRGRKGTIAICIAIFLFSVTVFLADVLSGASTLSDYVALFTAADSGETYYAVYATHSQDAGISYKNAAAIQAEGGAGYVMKRGEEYYVIVSAYSSEKEAKNVTDKHAGYGITKIKIPAFSCSAHPTLAAAERGKDLYHKAYETLYNAANEMATGTYGTAEMKKILSSMREEIAAYEESYRTSISGKEDAAGIEYKVQLKEMLAAFDNLLAHENDLVAEARYYSVMILHSYSLFAEKYYK